MSWIQCRVEKTEADIRRMGKKFKNKAIFEEEVSNTESERKTGKLSDDVILSGSELTSLYKS